MYVTDILMLFFGGFFLRAYQDRDIICILFMFFLLKTRYIIKGTLQKKHRSVLKFVIGVSQRKYKKQLCIFLVVISLDLFWKEKRFGKPILGIRVKAIL